MAHFHDRHATAVPIKDFVTRLLKHWNRHNRWAGGEVVDAPKGR
jgi:hypothetical protein